MLELLNNKQPNREENKLQEPALCISGFTKRAQMKHYLGLYRDIMTLDTVREDLIDVESNKSLFNQTTEEAIDYREWVRQILGLSLADVEVLELRYKIEKIDAELGTDEIAQEIRKHNLYKFYKNNPIH